MISHVNTLERREERDIAQMGSDDDEMIKELEKREKRSDREDGMEEHALASGTLFFFSFLKFACFKLILRGGNR